MKTKKITTAALLFGMGIAISVLNVNMMFFNGVEFGCAEAASNQGFVPGKIGSAEKKVVTEWYEAVGTVRPRTETRIEAQVTAQVLDVKVTPGERVTKGQILVSLDNRQFKSKLDQARQARNSAIAGKEQARQTVIAAEAAFNQAESDYKRTTTYFEQQAATQQDLERSESAFLQAKAQVKRAQKALVGADAGIRQAEEVVKEATIALGYTSILAPEAGEVLRRLVESGDLALPGKPLITLRTAEALRLEAYVREGLIAKVKTGTVLNVNIQTLGRTVDATVEEIVPYADPQSRTFLVKVSLPGIEGLYPGMFGKLLIPVQEHTVVVVPKAAVRRVGQLELVWVKENNLWKSRFIKTGNILGDFVEILSGLTGDETVGWEGDANE